MRRLSARPHKVGSPYDKDNAEWILAQLKSYGLDAQIETFDALFSTPKVAIAATAGLQPAYRKARGATLAVDPTSGQKSEQLPTYNAYSKDGDVAAPGLCNSGAPDDYEQLERFGHLGQGRDRDRALWRNFAGHQAQDCRRTRRRRLPHLFRSARGRVLP